MKEELKNVPHSDLLKMYDNVKKFKEFLEKEKKNVEKMREQNG